MKFLIDLLLWFGKQSALSRSIKVNEDARAKSTLFGTKSILFIVIGFVVSVAIALGGVLMVGTDNIAFIILGILFIAAGVLSALNFFVRSIYCAILQLRMNSKPIGIIALILSFLITVFVIIGIILIADNIF